MPLVRSTYEFAAEYWTIAAILALITYTPKLTRNCVILSSIPIIKDNVDAGIRLDVEVHN